MGYEYDSKGRENRYDIHINTSSGPDYALNAAELAQKHNHQRAQKTSPPPTNPENTNPCAPTTSSADIRGGVGSGVGGVDDRTRTRTRNGRIPEHQDKRWIWFITGPTACGKTTIAKYLAEKFHFTFLEGDDYHPRANVEKMSRGEPLTDEDREGWLEALRDHELACPPEGASPHLVMTCSALKRHYRDVLREGGRHAGNLRIRFVFLDAPEEVLVERAERRPGHFAKGNLVHSQFEALERPDDEDDVSIVNVADRSIEDTERDVEKHVREVMMHDDGSYLRLL